MERLWQILGLLVGGGAIKALVDYFGGRRNTQGRVSTSDASKLWDKTDQVQQSWERYAKVIELRNEALQQRLDTMESRVEDLVVKHQAERDEWHVEREGMAAELARRARLLNDHGVAL